MVKQVAQNVAQSVKIRVNKRRPVRAILSGVVTLCAYLLGIMGAEDSIADVSQVQWLGAVVFLGMAYGLYPSKDN